LPLPRRRKKMRTPMMAIIAAPPMEPPTMAPTGAGDDELAGVSEYVMFMVSAVEVVGEGDGEEVGLDEDVEEDWLVEELLAVELEKPVNVVKVLPTSPA
jgi:hypothetical protein